MATDDRADDATEGTREASQTGRYRLGPLLDGPGVPVGESGLWREVWDRELSRTLAMRLLPANAATVDVHRFVREARLVGQLDHPGIPSVHDLGVDDDDRVYYTQQFVRGTSLAARLAENALGVGGAVDVVMKLADALAYAHARGVVHCMLQPEGVLLGEHGEVFLLDWSGAQFIPGTEAIAAEFPVSTRSADSIEDSRFLAPEQKESGVLLGDPRVDVFSLGALLRIALGDDAPTDLIELCEEAAAVDPEKRFSDAAALAVALRDYQERARKAADDIRRVRDQLVDARQVADFLTGLFRVSTPQEAEEPVSMLQILDRGAERIERDLSEPSPLRGMVHATLGEIFTKVGSHNKADPHVVAGVEAARAHLDALHVGGGERTERVSVLGYRLTSLALNRFETGQHAEAEALFEEAVAVCRDPDANPEVLPRALTLHTNFLFQTGRHAEAREVLSEVARLPKTIPDGNAMSNQLLQQAMLMESLGDVAGGEDAMREALAMQERLHGADHSIIAMILVNLSLIAVLRRDYDVAIASCRRARKLRLAQYGARHDGYTLTLQNLAVGLLGAGELEESEAVFRECLATRIDVNDENHPSVANTRLGLASALVAKGALDEAAGHLDQVKSAVAGRASESHPIHAYIQRVTGELREAQGRFDESEEARFKAIELMKKATGPLQMAGAVDPLFLGEFYVRRGRFADALPILEECNAIFEKGFRETDPVRIECAALLERTRAELDGGA